MDSTKTRTEKKEQKILEEMEQHLVDRYGEFEHESYAVQLNGWDHPYDLCNMYIQQGESEEERDVFSVKRYYDIDTDSYYFTDNYYWHIIRDEYEEYIKNEVYNLIPDCKVYLTTDEGNESVSSEITGETSFNEFLNIGLPLHNVFVIINSESMTEETLKLLEPQLREEWVEKYPSPTIRFFLPSSKDVYKDINRYNRYDYLDNFVVEITNY